MVSNQTNSKAQSSANQEVRINSSGNEASRKDNSSKRRTKIQGLLPQLVVPFIIIGWLLNAIKVISLVLWLLLLLLLRCLPTAILML